jgi:hypothetical protein
MPEEPQNSQKIIERDLEEEEGKKVCLLSFAEMGFFLSL